MGIYKKMDIYPNEENDNYDAAADDAAADDVDGDDDVVVDDVDVTFVPL